MGRKGLSTEGAEKVDGDRHQMWKDWWCWDGKRGRGTVDADLLECLSPGSSSAAGENRELKGGRLLCFGSGLW